MRVSLETNLGSTSVPTTLSSMRSGPVSNVGVQQTKHQFGQLFETFHGSDTGESKGQEEYTNGGEF